MRVCFLVELKLTSFFKYCFQNLMAETVCIIKLHLFPFPLVTQLPIADCKTIGREKMYQFRVRAVNVVGDEHLIGPWSEAGEGNCYSDRPSNQVLMVIWVIGILSAVALVLCVIYTSKRFVFSSNHLFRSFEKISKIYIAFCFRTWLKCRYMRDVDVKLPHGIEPNMVSFFISTQIFQASDPVSHFPWKIPIQRIFT